MKNKGTNKQQQPDWGIPDTSAHCSGVYHGCVPSFNLLGLTVPEKSVMKNFNGWKLERKKNEEIKEQIRGAAWFRYTRYICSLTMCTKFHCSRLHSSWEKCDKKFQCLKIGEKENEEIKEQIRGAAWFRYTRYICPLSTCVPSFIVLGLTVSEKSEMKIFIWKVTEWQNDRITEWPNDRMIAGAIIIIVWINMSTWVLMYYWIYLISWGKR